MSSTRSGRSNRSSGSKGSSYRSSSLHAPSPSSSRRRRNSATTQASSKSSNSSKSNKSNVSSRSQSNDGRQPRYPRFTIERPEDPRTDEDCVVWLAELYDFLLEAHRFGIGRNKKLHPEVTAFIDTYGTRAIFAVQLAVQRICANETIFRKVLSYKPHVFADIIEICIQHLTSRIKNIKEKARSKDDAMLDEVFAAPLVSLLADINSPKANPRYAKACLQCCYRSILHYLVLVPHRCTQTAECNCYKNAGPIEAQIEEAALPAASKYTPELFLEHYPTIERHYQRAICFNHVLAISIMLVKGNLPIVERNVSKITGDMKTLLKNNKETMKSVLMIRTGVGQYVAQGQASDFVVISLDMIFKRLCMKHPKMMNKAGVDMLEEYYEAKRPMSCTLALECLKHLAKTRPDLMKNKRKKYLKVAEDLEMTDDQLEQFDVFD